MSQTDRKKKTTSTRRKRVQTLQLPKLQTLHPSDAAVRRLVLNQPSSRYGIKPGWFRDTISGDEHESVRCHFVLWSRGRVYFEAIGDTVPRCKSDDGAGPAEEIEAPIHECCGSWDDRGLFIAQCPLAQWGTEENERRSPPCKECWNLLGVAAADGMPFWISLKGASLRPARQFLSMCYARIRMQQAQLFQCAVTVSSSLAENRFGTFYIVQFRKPEWLFPEDAEYRVLAEAAAMLARERVERTFNREMERARPAA